MTARDALRAGVARLQASESARADASRLLGAAFGRDAAWLLAHDADPVPSGVWERFEAALVRRAAGEPVAYILGYAGFYGRRFAVTPSVLVPRPETEHVLELVLQQTSAMERPGYCDVGTGSGILAITLACERTDARVIAVDSSAAALRVAGGNAAAHGVTGRIAFQCGDLLEPVPNDARFDAIVANLPYVPTGELAAAPDPTSFEPQSALDGGPDGLSLYRRLLPQAARRLRAGGSAVFEAGPSTADALAGLAREAFGPDARVTVHRDYGARERAVLVVR